MGFSAPPAPVVPPPAPLPPAAHPATLATQAVAQIAAQSKSSAVGGLGYDGTLATGPQGLTEKPNEAKTTLLGG